MASITRQSPSHFNLCMLTAKKINVEAGKTEKNLRHLVLLCNTYDAQTFHLLDNYDQQERKPDEELPAYELYSSPNIDVNVTECSASSESSEDDEYDEEFCVETESDSKVGCSSRDFVSKLYDVTSHRTLKSPAVVEIKDYWLELKDSIELDDSPQFLKETNRCSSAIHKVVTLASSPYQGYAALIKSLTGVMLRKWRYGLLHHQDF